MAYRGPQEEAQQLLNKNVNNGNPGTANNMGAKMDNSQTLPGYRPPPPVTNAMRDNRMPATSQPMNPSGAPARPGPVNLPPNAINDANSGVSAGAPPPSRQDQLLESIMERLMGGARPRRETEYPSGTNQPNTMPRYIPPSGNGDVGGPNNFRLPNWPGLGPRIYPEEGFDPGSYLRNLFGSGASMAPSGGGSTPSGQRLFQMGGGNSQEELLRVLLERLGGGGG